MFYNYSVNVQAVNAFLSVVKNNWNRNFFDFLDLMKKKTIWQNLSNFTKVLGLIPYSYVQLATFKYQSLVDNKNSYAYLRNFTYFFCTDVFFHFLRQCLGSETYGAIYGASYVVGSERRKRIMFLISLMKFLKNLNSISNIFQKLHDLVAICIS